MAPALAAGNCVVLKPARLTPLSVLLLMEIVGDLLPPGVVNVVNGAGGEIGEYLATSKRIAKVAFTGSTEVGQQIMQYATQNIIPVTLELGGKSPNIFFADVMDEEDAFFDKALEGFALFAFNQGTSKRIAKVAFTGSTEVGQQSMQYATQYIIPVTLELGGKSPNIFFADVMDEEDAFFYKALEGFALFAFNQGEV